MNAIKRYTPQDEHHIDICCDAAKRAMQRATESYLRFAGLFRKELDFKTPEKIEAVHEAAVREGILEQARELRTLFFGKDIHFYGVSYIWDHCVEACTYCPGSITNRANTYKPRQMTVEEALKDTKAVMQDGHSHICYLTGEDPTGHPARILAAYLTAVDTLGLDEIILNIDPKTSEDFMILRAAVKETPLQFRVFQESYDRDSYAAVHPVSKKGIKHDFDFRRESQARALGAGFDNVGIGALLGLHRYPIDEIDGLRQHTIDLTAKGTAPARVCLPSANFMDRIGVAIPYHIERGQYEHDGTIIGSGPYEWSSEVLYALAKLAMPQVNLVSSERDPKGLLQILDDYSACTTLNVRPGVGDNLHYHNRTENDEIHFEQSVSFSRNPKDTLIDMRQRGFVPKLKEDERAP